MLHRHTSEMGRHSRNEVIQRSPSTQLCRPEQAVHAQQIEHGPSFVPIVVSVHINNLSRTTCSRHSFFLLVPLPLLSLRRFSLCVFRTGRRSVEVQERTSLRVKTLRRRLRYNLRCSERRCRRIDTSRWLCYSFAQTQRLIKVRIT